MHYLGIDLGGTNIAAAIVDENGTILRRCSTPTPADQDSIAAVITEECNKLLAEEKEPVAYIGIGSPGAIDPVNGIVIYRNNRPVRNFHIAELVSKGTGLKVLIENDANCAAIGEYAAGAGKGSRNMVAVTLGTGVGGGAVLDGKLYTGSNYCGMELGHHVIRKGGKKCSCGRLGCFESYCSATAAIRDAREAMQQHPESLMWKLAGSLDKVEGRTLTDAAKQGDPTACAVLQEFTEMLACGLTNLVNLMQPDVVCVGGGLANAGSILLDPVQKIFDEEDYARYNQKRARICLAQLGNDAGLVGAAFIGKYRSF